jgi:hypothetical protein
MTNPPTEGRDTTMTEGLTGEEARLAAMSNNELVEKLTLYEGLDDLLWVEVALRLGVERVHGIRAAAVPEVNTGPQAERLRRFMELWQGQPEARHDG